MVRAGPKVLICTPLMRTDSRQKAARWGWNEVAVFVIICQGMLVW